MQISFGRGLVEINGKYYNPDNIESFEELSSSKGNMTRMDFISGKSTFLSDTYPISKIAAACVEAQICGSVVSVKENKNNNGIK